MEKNILQIYQKEVRRQCDIVLEAIQDIGQLLKTPNLNTHENICHIWYSIQGFLVADANISKLFWPPKKHYKKRGIELRRSLSIDEGSPLRARAPRNYLEHFDEFLDQWVKSTKNPHYIHISIGSLDQIKLEDPNFEKADFFTFFDYKKFIIVFNKFSADLKPIIDAIQKLQKKVQEELKNLKW